MRLIDAEKLEYKDFITPIIEADGMVYPLHQLGVTKEDIKNAQTIDAVPRKAFDGILWENDVMRKQLADIGKPFGAKMDDVVKVVRCKDCKHRYTHGENVVWNCCDLNHTRVQSDDWFCADGKRKQE